MSYQTVVAADEPWLAWRLGEAEGSTSVADASGNGRTGTPTSGATFGAPGLLRADANSALALDGVALSDYQAKVLADRPLAYWPLQEGEGSSTAADASGNGHDGTYPTGGTVTPGQPGPGGGRCALFADSYGGVAGPGGPGISIANPSGFPVAPTAMTVEYWVNPVSPGGSGFSGRVSWPETVLSLGDPDVDTAYFKSDITLRGQADPDVADPDVATEDVSLYGSSDGAIDGVFDPGLWPVGTWHHVVLTWDNAEGTLWNVYLDGTALPPYRIGASAPFAAQSGSFSAAWLGTTANDAWQTLIGGLAHVAVYDQALEAAQVRAHYAALAAPSAGPLVAQDDSSTLPATASIELWLKTTTSAGGCLAQFASADGAQRDLTLYLRTDGTPAFRAGSTEIARSAGPPVNDGRIYHLVATIDAAGDQWLYVNGNQAAHAGPDVALGASFSGRWQIGCGVTDDLAVPPVSAAYQGTLDEFCVYTD